MTGLPPLNDLDLFDEAGYLRLYPGIAEAIMTGLIDNGLDHFLRHGRGESRRPNDVDPAFYLTSYPDMAHDLGRAPSPDDAAAHFVTIGRGRGYRPNAAAPRVTNGAALGSPFGGLWLDQANALDLIQARLDLERIRPRDAHLARSFALDGFVELAGSFDKERMDAAALAVEQAFTGRFPNLLFAAADADAKQWGWRPELTPLPVAAQDPHMMSRAIRDVLLDRQVTEVLTTIFEAKPKLTASRASLRQPLAPDRDVAWFAHSLPLQAVSVTFALDDSEPNLMSVWPGSHRLPDLPWSHQHICFSEAVRAQIPGLDAARSGRAAAVLGLLAGRAPRVIEETYGTRIVRHANLIHTTRAPEPLARRRSLTAWYCPSFGSPTYMETGHVRVHNHDGFSFSSGVYPALDPLE